MTAIRRFIFSINLQSLHGIGIGIGQLGVNRRLPCRVLVYAEFHCRSQVLPLVAPNASGTAWNGLLRSFVSTESLSQLAHRELANRSQ
jgi:hypothetical protein